MRWVERDVGRFAPICMERQAAGMNDVAARSARGWPRAHPRGGQEWPGVTHKRLVSSDTMERSSKEVTLARALALRRDETIPSCRGSQIPGRFPSVGTR